MRLFAVGLVKSAIMVAVLLLTVAIPAWNAKIGHVSPLTVAVPAWNAARERASKKYAQTLVWFATQRMVSVESL
jgi:hypothetical protein